MVEMEMRVDQDVDLRRVTANRRQFSQARQLAESRFRASVSRRSSSKETMTPH
jgi:hypothetical protein